MPEWHWATVGNRNLKTRQQRRLRRRADPSPATTIATVNHIHINRAFHDPVLHLSFRRKPNEIQEEEHSSVAGREQWSCRRDGTIWQEQVHQQAEPCMPEQTHPSPRLQTFGRPCDIAENHLERLESLQLSNTPPSHSSTVRYHVVGERGSTHSPWSTSDPGRKRRQ